MHKWGCVRGPPSSSVCRKLWCWQLPPGSKRFFGGKIGPPLKTKSNVKWKNPESPINPPRSSASISVMESGSAEGDGGALPAAVCCPLPSPTPRSVHFVPDGVALQTQNFNSLLKLLWSPSSVLATRWARYACVCVFTHAYVHVHMCLYIDVYVCPKPPLQKPGTPSKCGISWGLSLIAFHCTRGLASAREAALADGCGLGLRSRTVWNQISARNLLAL